VRLRDLDLLRHMTNSAYLSVLDLARVAGVDEKAVHFEHRFTVQGEIYAPALVRMRFVKAGTGAVPIDEIIAMADARPTDRVLQPWMKDWAAGTTLPSTRHCLDTALDPTLPRHCPRPDTASTLPSTRHCPRPGSRS
jgi:hypothetical protein